MCLSRTASVGFVVSMGMPMATSQDFMNWVCEPDLNPRYLHYLLMCEQESIRRFAHGTTHQTVYYPEAKASHVCIPERRIQDMIAGVLEALDDKIAINDRISAASFRIGRQPRYLQVSPLARVIGSGRANFLTSSTVRLYLPLIEYPGAVPVFGSGGVCGRNHEETLVPRSRDNRRSQGDSPAQFHWSKDWLLSHRHDLLCTGSEGPEVPAEIYASLPFDKLGLTSQ